MKNQLTPKKAAHLSPNTYVLVHMGGENDKNQIKILGHCKSNKEGNYFFIPEQVNLYEYEKYRNIWGIGCWENYEILTDEEAMLWILKQ
jgi:hypothetical protein